jgi:hypothetical protein
VASRGGLKRRLRLVIVRLLSFPWHRAAHFLADTVYFCLEVLLRIYTYGMLYRLNRPTWALRAEVAAQLAFWLMAAYTIAEAITATKLTVGLNSPNQLSRCAETNFDWVPVRPTPLL